METGGCRGFKIVLVVLECANCSMHVMVGTVLNGLTKYSAQTVPAVSEEADVGGGQAISPTDLLISPRVHTGIK